jgi:hypothetical protein
MADNKMTKSFSSPAAEMRSSEKQNLPVPVNSVSSFLIRTLTEKLLKQEFCRLELGSWEQSQNAGIN